MAQIMAVCSDMELLCDCPGVDDDLGDQGWQSDIPGDVSDDGSLGPPGFAVRSELGSEAESLFGPGDERGCDDVEESLFGRGDEQDRGDGEAPALGAGGELGPDPHQANIVAAVAPEPLHLLPVVRRSLLSWLRPGAGLQANLASCMRPEAPVRRADAVETMKPIAQLTSPTVPRRSATLAAEASHIDKDPRTVGQHIQDFAACSWQVARLLGRGWFGQIADLIAHGFQPTLAITSISYDETPLLMRTGADQVRNSSVQGLPNRCQMQRCTRVAQEAAFV